MAKGKQGRLKPADNISFDPWWWQARNRETLPEPELPAHIDYAVVGGGFTGLSAALTLARAGAKVVVFDSKDPGDGASSRNGGMVGNRLRTPFTGLARRFGDKQAVALLDEAAKSLDYVESLVIDNDINCDFSRKGRVAAALNKSHWQAMRDNLEAEKSKRDIEAEMIAPEEMSQFLGTTVYHGGMLQHDTAGVHPARLHDGLLAAVQQAGAMVAARTSVLTMEETDTGMALETSLGFIDADKVLVCTNGYTGPLVPDLQSRVIPVTSAMIATEELDPDLVARLIPGGRMISDSRKLLNYFRASPDGKRILLGSRPRRNTEDGLYLASTLGDRLGTIFPELDGTAITHCWWGNVAFSFDSFPKIGMNEKVGYAMCYAGSGVAMSNWLGHKLAQKAMGDLAGRTALDDMPFTSPFYYRGWPWFMGPTMSWYGFRDWLAA